MAYKDLHLAIWRINPTAGYLLTDAKDDILEWRGPGTKPTAAALQAADTAAQADITAAQAQATSDATDFAAGLAALKTAAATDPKIAALLKVLKKLGVS